MSVCCESCVLSGRGLCDELITLPKEFYRLCRVVVCGIETSWMRRPRSTGGLSRQEKKNTATVTTSLYTVTRNMLVCFRSLHFFSTFSLLYQ
jgi:hypothetical protein